MQFPMNLVFKIPHVFGENDINISLYSGLTTFVGPNGSGKTQVMKQLKNQLGRFTNGKRVRYLSADRIGPLEQFRSQTTRFGIANDPTIGDKESLKNRYVIEVATGDFLTMDARKDIYIKVSERLRVLFKRNILLRWDSGNLKIFFDRTDLSNEYSIAAEASGLINLASILVAIYDDEVGALLIDEPEVSLHPQLQAFVLREIKNSAGDPSEQGKKIIIMATHSIDMLDIRSANELPNFVFFSQDSSLPKQVSPEAGELKSEKIKELIPRLGQAHKTAFFAKQPLLVEGISDSLFCRYFDERYNLYLGVAGTQIVPVDGKGQFAAITKLMRTIGKRPVVLADLDAFTDDNYLVDLFAEDEVAKQEALLRGHHDLPGFVRDVKTDFCNICDRNWEALKYVFETHSYWKNRKEDENGDASKAKRRAAMAMLMSESDERITTWSDVENWKEIKIRINVLFDCLEKAGCFILRKGAIESYYIYSDKETSEGKPSAALEEIESLRKQTDGLVNENYHDILRALHYSSNTDQIDESEAIKRDLLCEVAPILHILSDKTTVDEINAFVRQLRGTDKTLFTYEPIIQNGTLGIRVDLLTKIIDVVGFPFIILKGNNVNEVVKKAITNTI